MGEGAFTPKDRLILISAGQELKQIRGIHLKTGQVAQCHQHLGGQVRTEGRNEVESQEVAQLDRITLNQQEMSLRGVVKAVFQKVERSRKRLGRRALRVQN